MGMRAANWPAVQAVDVLAVQGVDVSSRLQRVTFCTPSLQVHTQEQLLQVHPQEQLLWHDLSFVSP
jgi:hypothetical protein